jgi:hypothetical protein
MLSRLITTLVTGEVLNCSTILRMLLLLVQTGVCRDEETAVQVAVVLITLGKVIFRTVLFWSGKGVVTDTTNDVGL